MDGGCLPESRHYRYCHCSGRGQRIFRKPLSGMYLCVPAGKAWYRPCPYDGKALFSWGPNLSPEWGRPFYYPRNHPGSLTAAFAGKKCCYIGFRHFGGPNRIWAGYSGKPHLYCGGTGYFRRTAGHPGSQQRGLLDGRRFPGNGIGS